MKRFWFLSLGLFALTCAANVPAASERPNIIFAIADDWGWPHASAYGDPAVKTPAFDRVAKDGFFSNTHTFRHRPVRHRATRYSQVNTIGVSDGARIYGACSTRSIGRIRIC